MHELPHEYQMRSKCDISALFQGLSVSVKILPQICMTGGQTLVKVHVKKIILWDEE